MTQQDSISRARAQVDDAQTILLEETLERIRHGYQTLDPKQKESVLDGLGALVTSIEGGRRKNSAYDPERAKEIRENAGLSQLELAEELGLGKSGQQQICKYERGKAKPSNPPRGITSSAYISWLMENGYNPFEL